MTALAPWDGDIRAARELQARLAQRVLLRDDFARPLRSIAGFDVGFEDEGATTRAAAVLLEADTCCIPGYTPTTLTNASASEPAFLFLADESPLHRKLGVYEVRPDNQPAMP